MKIRVPRFIRRDWPRKLVALFFAVLIWFTVANQLREFESYHDIPITLRYPPDKITLDRRIFTADITLGGSRHRLQQVKSTDIRVTAEVPVVREGVYYYDLHLGPDNVNAPPGTKVIEINPENIRLQLDRIVSRELPVRVRETGELGYGYKTIQRKILPSTVTITGPSKIVNDVETIVTEAVVLDESVAHSFEVDKDLIPVPNVDVNPESVHVAYEIAKHSGQKVFADLPISVLNRRHSALRVQDDLPTASVTVRGIQLALEELDPRDIHAFIDISAITNAGRYSLPLQVWIEEEPRLVPEYVHPEQVEVVIEPAEAWPGRDTRVLDKDASGTAAP